MSGTYLLNLCEQCATMALGMTLDRVSPAVDVCKCQFCNKKKPCHSYRVTVIGKGERTDG